MSKVIKECDGYKNTNKVIPATTYNTYKQYNVNNRKPNLSYAYEFCLF